MEKFTVGTVVLVLFPFSNLKGQKIRPALVLANSDFTKGSLPVVSFIRPDKLFTADTTIIYDVSGVVNKEKKREIIRKVRNVFKS
jgi:mRNA interferase MazF